MNFCGLRDRLVERIRQLTGNGAISESYLARRLGISQPHLHNTLKGVRSVTLQTADQLLGNLGWTALDLCDPADLQRALRKCRAHAAGRTRSAAPGRPQTDRLLPVHTLGPHSAEPDWFRQVPVPKEFLANLACPELCLVAAKLDTGGIAFPSDLLLIDRVEPVAPHSVKRGETAAAAYVVAIKRTGTRDCLALRWISRGARSLYRIEGPDNEPAGAVAGRRLSLRWRPMAEGEQIIARIHAISRQPSGRFQPPARPSGAS